MINPCNKYSWNIFIGGHGLNVSMADGSGFDSVIATVPAQEFSALLQFFNQSIKTNILLYSSCFGGGKNTISPYMINEQTLILNYSIVNLSLTDTVSYVFASHINQQPFADKSLSSYVFNSKKQAWNFQCLYQANWKAFFKKLKKRFLPTQPFKALECLKNDLLPLINPPKLATGPLVRWAESKDFIHLYQQDLLLHINQALLTLKEYTKQPILIEKNTKCILLDVQHIHNKIIINNDASSHFISLLPGTAMHYFDTIELNTMNLYNFATCFEPLETYFDKTYYIKHVICKAATSQEQENDSRKNTNY